VPNGERRTPRDTDDRLKALIDQLERVIADAQHLRSQLNALEPDNKIQVKPKKRSRRRES
jgi:hypothetical protein